MDIWSRLFDGTGFIPRAQCGNWTPALIRLHNISDFFIWTAYLAIPTVLIYFASKRRGDLPFQQVFWLFGVFIIACGTTHLMDIVLFYNPVYRLAGVIKLITAAASWGTVIALRDIVPRALAMRSPEVMEREIAERIRAEDEVRRLNASLEERVLARTSELEAANAVKDELLVKSQEAQREAEEANRAKDEFLATVSHELRTPLNAMLGWSNLLRTDGMDEDTRIEAVETIESSARVQMQIIDDILDVSRFVMGKFHLDMQQVNLRSVVEASLSTVQPTLLAKNITATMEATAESVVIAGDPGRLQQVVWNILNNAIKFTPPGGSIQVRFARTSDTAEIAITDSGKGISPEFLPYVFDRFRQGDSSSTRVHGGLGLGLSIVKHIVELHAGSVRVTSAGPGLGSTFTLSLPLLREEDLRLPEKVAVDLYGIQAGVDHRAPDGSRLADPGLPLHGARVLVVDDDAGARRIVSKILELQGAEIKVASSAAQAMEVLDFWPPDVIVSDIGMPEEDGIGLIKRIRTHADDTLRALPALALSAFAGSNDRKRSLEAGYQIHLSKPVEPKNLVSTVQQLINH